MQKMLLIVPNQRYMYLIDQMKLLSSRERQDPSTQHFACLSEQERQNFAKSFKIPRDIWLNMEWAMHPGSDYICVKWKLFAPIRKHGN